MHSGRKIFLIGFMGSGKSTAGKKLASHFGWSFVDLDEKIEILTGMKIPEIFSEKGELWFRETEALILHDLKDEIDTVISTGGGTPCFGDNMDFMLDSGLTVYLRLTPEQLEKRLTDSTSDRPLIKNVSKKKLKSFIVKKLDEREPYYSRAAIIIDGSDTDNSLLFSIVRDWIG
jgi:shikimate kinase